MIFGYMSDIKPSVMKKLIYILIAVAVISSCTASKESGTARKEQKMADKIAEQQMVKKAVESRRYIIKMNKLYMAGGSFTDLVPRSNYIIVNGEIASVSLGYVGRTFASRPVSGINFNGQTVKYEMKSDETKGMYNVVMTVKKGNATFDLYLTIGSSGFCTVSLNNANIQTVTYRGNLTPISEVKKGPEERKERL